MAPKSFNPAKDIPALTGKVIAVTGGSSGLGKETIRQLVQHSPRKVFLAARNETKARGAIKSIIEGLNQRIDIEWIPLDTASLPSVKAAAELIKQRCDRLDVVILNAGIMATPPERSETGHDLQLATNHIGHFLLVKELMPILVKTANHPDADVRIVSVSSEAYNMGPALEKIMSTEKLCAAGPWERYGASKAANILFAAELARRHPQLTSVSLHPGMIKTDLWKHDDQSHSFMKYFMSIFGSFLYRTAEEGAHNQLYLAAGAQQEDLQNGSYYTPVGSAKKNKFATDVAGGKKFWEWTENVLAKAEY